MENTRPDVCVCARAGAHAWVAGELIRGIGLERRKGRGGQTELAVFDTLNSRILCFGSGEPVVILESPSYMSLSVFRLAAS